MKTKKILFSILIGITLNAQSTEPTVDFFTEIDNKKYHVTELTGSYNQLRTQLQQSSWWAEPPNQSYENYLLELNSRHPDYKPNLIYDFFIASPIVVYGEVDDNLYVSWIEDFDTYGLSGTIFYISGDGEKVFSWLFSTLVVEPEDTLASFRPQAFALRNAFNLQSAKIAQGLSYDCTVYDQKNICVSFAGTRSEGKDFDATTGALIIAHQPSKHFRLGAYVDQSYDASTFGGLTTKNGKPGFGVFGVWTQNTDGLGAQVRVSANMGKVGIETQREAVETAEAGFGKSNIESRGWQLEYSQGYAINSIWTARPYVGYRKTTHTRAAYTEQSSDDVTAPLTYGSVKQNTDTVTAGITFAHTEMAKTSMFLTAGVEHELRNRMDRYGASSSEIEGIGSIDLSTDKRKTHLALALTVNHDIDKTQRIGVSLNHRKEAFAPGAVTSAGVQYSKGF